jgi:hypothetical protein
MKYGNRKVTTNDGIIHDSQREAVRWMELTILLNAGMITNLRRQVKYILIPAQYMEVKGKKKGKLVERECSYIADFVYEQNGETIVEDTKGFRTKDYIIKRKLMLFVYGIRVMEV